MGKYIDSEKDKQNTANTQEVPSSSNVKMRPASKQLTENVKNNVQIPEYFYSVIVPNLGSYYSTYPVDFDAKPVVCCPLHDEDTPSFRFYEDTNSFFCFGCRKGGNIVTLHRYFAEKMNGEMPTYEEAVNFLNDYFLKGQDTKSFITIKGKVDTKKNTDEQLIKFNMYRYEMEEAITFDNSINLDDKKRLWELFDNISILLSKDMIYCDDAKETIQQELKKLTGGK